MYQGSRNKEKEQNNFLRIKLKGNANNRQALGTKIILYYDSGKVQYIEESVYRGFLSSVEDVIHFGLGNISVVDSVVVQWPDGKIDGLQNVNANQVLTIEYKQSNEKKLQTERPVNKGTFFAKANTEIKRFV